MRRTLRGCRTAVGILVGLSLGCRDEIVPAKYHPTNAHDAYSHSLEEAGLADTALGGEWLQAADRVLTGPVSVVTPFRETVYVDPSSAFALGYRFSVLRGQRIEVEANWSADSPGRLFIDLYRLEADQGSRHTASAPANERRLEFEPRRDGEYLVRFQSELLRGGELTVTIINRASLEFPVAGQTSDAIQSGFGAPRDGGRRRHHGVDIFAPRHTPVLAPAHARVSYVGEHDIGGRVVWLRDSRRSLSLYFAHLQSQSVKQGAWVEPGDEIGTVGNSGNARTTPPHLHFGIYMRGIGPLDPLPFIRQPSLQPKPMTVDRESLGRWLRTIAADTPLRSAPDSRAGEVLRADRHTPMKIVGGSADFSRVRLADGLEGFVKSAAVEPAQPLRVLRLASEHRLLDGPALGASAKDRLSSGLELEVLGSFRSFDWVQAPDGRRGWLMPHSSQ